MSNIFSRFQEFLNNGIIHIPNQKMNKVVQNYSFIYATNNMNLEQNQKIIHNLKESKVIIIGYYKESNQKAYDLNFILGFKNTILIINLNSISVFNSLFNDKKENEIYFLADSKNIFDQHVKIEYKETNANFYFKNEILNFNQQFDFIISKEFPIIKIWKVIQSCISGYLIKESYLKLSTDRIQSFYSNQKNSMPIKNIKKDEYIELRQIGMGTCCAVKLIYLIEIEELFVIKEFIKMNNENSHILKRETENYLSIKHPFLPKFYGTTVNNNFLIIEFIDVNTLLDIKKLKLSDIDKLTIIGQLLSVIKYLHKRNFIYRDLKPNNIMINHHKTAILIDFDRMIKKNKDEEHTIDFSSFYVAPEINSQNFNEKVDIYSIGKLIYFIINEKNASVHSSMSSNDFENFPELKIIYDKCIKEKPNERPSILELVNDFYSFIISRNFILENLHPKDQYKLAYIHTKENNISKAIQYITFASNQNHIKSNIIIGVIYITVDINKSIYHLELAANQNHPIAQYKLGKIFLENKYIPRDINKSIHYLELAANQNHPKAQYKLGKIFLENKCIPRDINKSIHYLELAANQNHQKSQCYLGSIYFNGGFLPKNINKSIHYYELAAKQNNSEAQYQLGLTYYEGKYITKNVDKGIYYMTLASNQNHSGALFKLGYIYYIGKEVPRDINKSINYYIRSSNLNHKTAQHNLALIYFENIYIPRNITKAIHYFTLAANLNDSDSQVNLGMIYLSNDYTTRDIKKAIHYFKLASEQNEIIAQINLGLIYYYGDYIKQDIEQSIYYLTLAANQNHLEAHFKLGEIYYIGINTQKDIKKSLFYFNIAASQNHARAQCILGLIYYDGKYVKRDIDKSIYYLKLASNQNLSNAQTFLGKIYYRSNYIPRDINKSIYYFSLASDQQDTTAQLLLGEIYLNGEYVKKDIQKSIYYFQLASDQNEPEAQFLLGKIYYNIVSTDINKSIYYFSKAADKNYAKAQYYLGLIYYEGKYVQQDKSKAISNFTKAANQNNPESQLYLGLIYYCEKSNKQDIYKGIDYIMQSAKNGNIQANFLLGFFYHEGKYLKRDIKKAIKFYKEASSFNYEYAKNNLGILYKNGFGSEIEKNIKVAKIYFKEAIRQKNNFEAMYNLAHIYIYEEATEKSINKSIKLLINSSVFDPSLTLLCLVLINKHGLNIENIKKELEKNDKNLDNLFYDIIQMIEHQQFNDSLIFELNYQYYKNIDFLFNHSYSFLSNDLYDPSSNIKHIEAKNKFAINTSFYEGFGNDI